MYRGARVAGVPVEQTGLQVRSLRWCKLGGLGTLQMQAELRNARGRRRGIEGGNKLRWLQAALSGLVNELGQGFGVAGVLERSQGRLQALQLESVRSRPVLADFQPQPLRFGRVAGTVPATIARLVTASVRRRSDS